MLTNYLLKSHIVVSELEQNDTICLETIWQNKKAQLFYEKNNFSIYENIFYFKKLN